MKRKAESKKSTLRKKPSRSISLRIAGDFVKWNCLCLAAVCVCYIIVFLFLLQRHDIYNNTLAPIITDLLGKQGETFLFSHSYLLIPVVFLPVLIINSVIYSLLTLSLFNKTYNSLDALTDEKADFITFPKSYSDIEIKLRDIRLDVVGSRQAAAEAESRKNDLVMYLAHDLKTPLTSVLGYLTLLQESPELTVSQRAKFTDIALNKAYRLEQLIDEFFEITRFDISRVTLERNRINLGLLLAQISDEFYPMLTEKKLVVDIDIPDEIIMFADADKIARVFDNLLKNAVNYCYESTMIRIGARIRQNKVIIKFRNKCDEIPQEKLEKLFDKFYRSDSSRASSTGGSGLGLAIAKQLTELHGGTIRAKSSEDYTDFTVILPYVDASEVTDEQLDF